MSDVKGTLSAIASTEISWDGIGFVLGSECPLAYFQKYPGRFELWHVKDMDKADKERNADVGTGSIDFTALLANAKKSGMKHFFMEQETYPTSPMESTRKSIEYLKTII